MIRKIVIVCIVLFQSFWVVGQASVERQALKSLRKGKWDKAYDQLKEGYAKDTTSIHAAYLLAYYFIIPENPRFQPDSAYRYSLKAINDYPRTTMKQRDRLFRLGVDSVVLIEQQQQIDSVAFTRARQINTEDAYVHFLNHFPSAVQFREQTIALRDEAAYRTAIQENSYQSFYDFLAKYPDSEQRIEAKIKYEELLFKNKTSDGRLASYEQYLIQYPNTAYQREAERNVFEISTSSGTLESYRAFLESDRGSYFTRRACDILFHLAPRDQVEEYLPGYLDSDSLQNVLESGNGYLVPFLHNGEFGFMNQRGEEVIQVGKAEMNEDYRCGNVTEDVIVLPTKIVAPSGAVIWDHPVESVEDIGYGFITVEEEGCVGVLHKSGFKIGSDCITEAKVLNGKYLALRKDDLWSIWSFNGRLLMSYQWDDITAIKNVVCLKSRQRIVLSTMKSIASLADQQTPILLDSVDEVKPWRNDAVWIRKGNLQGVINQSLDTLIQAGDQALSQAYFGTIATSKDGIKTITDSGRQSSLFQRVVVQVPWTAVQTNQAWHLYEPLSGMLISRAYDSISFRGPFVIASGTDSISVYFSTSQILKVKKPVRVAFIPGQDSSSFLLLEQDKKKTIYSLKGKKMFTVSYDDVQYVGEGFFSVQKRDKKGIITSAGKVILPLSYDAIGTVNKGVVSLLSAMKFGMFHCAQRKLIKPQYLKNVTVYNNKVLTAYKNGLYGFIGWKTEPLSNVEFEEVRFWNDSAALVRKNSQWMIYNIASKKIMLDKIHEYKLVRDNQDGKLAIVQQDHRFGVIHSKRGTIIPISFSDLINVGSPAEPLYFTEKHVEEASIFVVIYYDSKGKMLRREIYEQDDYEKIYCSNN